MGGFRLGRIFGLEIRIDPSWLIIFVLVLWSFTVGVFPQRHPDQSIVTYLVMGTSGTLLFFVSVLLHEMAHSLVAIRRGVEVEGITLFVFGGIAHARSEFENPRDEFVIAAAGPAASFVIAGMLAAIAAAGRALELSVAFTSVAAYLGLLNLILAAFNLLPGFPLDGGRLLRAAVWRVTGDMTKATRVASLGGRSVGFFLIGLGLLQVLAGALIGGLWMMLIGWFVQMAAGSGFTQHLLRAGLANLRVADVLPDDIQATRPERTIDEFLAKYRYRGRHRAYPVVDDYGVPLGIITFQHIGKVPLERRLAATVGETMSRIEDGMIIDADAPISEALDRVQQAADQPLLAVRDQRLVGVITSDDFRRWLERARVIGVP